MISIKELQTFVAIVQEKSFTKAAERTYQSQSAVSKQLKKLEIILGVELVERYEREISLTDFGDIFYQYAVVILENYNRAWETIQELQQLQGGYLDIGASTLPGEYILPAIIGKFKEHFPKINIRLQIAKTDEVITMLRTRAVNIAFIGNKITDHDIDIKHFIDDRLILVGRNQVGEPTKPTLRKCIDSLIMREQGSGTRKVVEKHLADNNLALPSYSTELGSNRAILSAVMSGIGYAFLSEWVIQDALELGKIQPIMLGDKSRIKRGIYFATLKERYINPATREFQHFLENPSRYE